jgi:hypothetical protein
MENTRYTGMGEGDVTLEIVIKKPNRFKLLAFGIGNDKNVLLSEGKMITTDLKEMKFMYVFTGVKELLLNVINGDEIQANGIGLVRVDNGLFTYSIKTNGDVVSSS